jgi:hypothetical protein
MTSSQSDISPDFKAMLQNRYTGSAQCISKKA